MLWGDGNINALKAIVFHLLTVKLYSGGTLLFKALFQFPHPLVMSVGKTIQEFLSNM